MPLLNLTPCVSSPRSAWLECRYIRLHIFGSGVPVFILISSKSLLRHCASAEGGAARFPQSNQRPVLMSCKSPEIFLKEF